jgi:hypothetical protein
MKLPERLSRRETIILLKRKRDDLRDQYNGILAGVISGDESWVGERIYQLDEQIEKLQSGAL